VEVDLTPESLAVRGGSNRDVDSLMEKIEDAVADGFGPVLSIFCGTPVAGESHQETMRRICTDAGIPHPRVLVARASDLLASGLTLEWDTSDGQARNHFHATFTQSVEESQVHGFISCFDGPMPNPTGGRGGRAR
jgi:hypothetical protein